MRRVIGYLGILNVLAFLMLAGVSVSETRAAEAESTGCCEINVAGEGFCCISCICSKRYCSSNAVCPDRPGTP
jgi:hypothetical protein